MSRLPLVSHSLTVCNYPNAEGVALRWVDGVFFQHARAAAAVAKPHDGTVYRQIGVALVLEFVVVGL